MVSVILRQKYIPAQNSLPNKSYEANQVQDFEFQDCDWCILIHRSIKYMSYMGASMQRCRLGKHHFSMQMMFFGDKTAI